MPQLVSIVVPAYNAAKRIEATLLSIAAQDYENIEIIVVDDGSSDGTGDLAESVLRRSGGNFRIIKHESNMGVSAARNSGLRSVSGNYVIFFDADDLADPNFVSVLFAAITQNDSDVAFCGYRYRFEDTGKEQIVPLKLDSLRQYSAEELLMMYIFGQIWPLMWSTMFKTGFIKTSGLEFTVGCGFGEDLEFLRKALSRCGSISFSTGCHYIYVQHEGMTVKTTKQTPEKLLRRYADDAGAICRTAQYFWEHAKSPKIRAIGMNFLLPKGLIKTLNVMAWRHDKTGFYQTLRAPGTRRALAASFRYLPREPEMFFKAAALLIAPQLYFRMRSRSF